MTVTFTVLACWQSEQRRCGSPEPGGGRSFRCFWRSSFSGFSAIRARHPQCSRTSRLPRRWARDRDGRDCYSRGPEAEGISIFLSVFDVHVNRAPIAGEITDISYHKGKFMNAMNPACAECNERNVVTMRGEGIEIVFKQIAGLLARRIVFPGKVGDRVERGQRVGMIKFGSRTDLILPGDAEIQVKVGQRVKGRLQHHCGYGRGIASPALPATGSAEPRPIFGPQVTARGMCVDAKRGGAGKAKGPQTSRHVPASVPVHDGQYRGGLFRNHTAVRRHHRANGRAHSA